MKGIGIFASRLGLFSIICLLLAAPSGAVLADADPAPPPARPAPHLLLVPDTADGVVALAGTDARLLARYESFSLVEAAGGDDRSLRAAGAQRRDDMRDVTTAAGAIDPRADRRSLAGKRAGDRDAVLALVQFIGPPKDAWLIRLRATGARIVTYQAENAYVVHATGDAVDRLAGLVGTDPAVRAVASLTAADKVDDEAAVTASYAVSTVTGAAVSAGRATGTPTTIGAQHIQYRELTPSEVEQLARDPAVVAIERDVPPTPSDERTSQIVAGNVDALAQPSGPAYLDWHDPAFPGPFDVTIDFTDSGLDNGASPTDHPDFHEGGSASDPDRIAYEADYTAPPPSGPDLDTDPRDCTGHGTNVASIGAGYNDRTDGPNRDAGGYRYGLGVAPLARIGVSKVFQSCSAYDGPDAGAAPDHAFSLAPGTTFSDVAAAAYAGGARVSNNSWGSASLGSYTSSAAQYDELVRDAAPTGGNQPMVEIFSAGNDGEEGYGSVETPGTAKNVITVGASESVRASGLDGCLTPDTGADAADDVIDFSSRGPTDDGRLKPDLVAPGTHVTGARPTHGTYNGAGTCNPVFASTAYSLVSGTSQAAPQVAGAAALVRDWYERTVPGAAVPSPAMTKALLINGATDLAGGDNGKGDAIAGGPNADQGWGRVNLGTTFASPPREYYDQLPGDVLTNPGQTVVRAYNVQDGSKPVKVTAVWTDPPGPLTGNAFVNNLDLEVAAGGEVYRGNVFGGSYSRSGGMADIRNNVESVYLPPGFSGRFSVTVRATTLLGDGLPGSGDATDQDFALVVSNAAEQAAPVLAHQSTTIHDSGAGGDGDGVLESDEQVELTEQLRNAGNADASAPTATLAGGPGLAVTQGSSTYPTIMDDDGLGANDTRFAAHLANAATCGADASATLAVSTVSGIQTVPLVLPTGEPGALQTNLAAGPQVPLSIPDDNAAGVASSVFVPDRGRIKDLDVTIPAIAHSWVGDLVIDITGPDGTTVRLADHPGGPDNSDDNFTNTIFDDQAGTAISQGTAPYTGNFKPQNDQLSRFNGKSRRGTWTLRVRDLFDGDTGTLLGWGVASQKALCDIDTTPPETSITAAPANPTSATSAQFSFGSDDGGASFECRLDGAAYEPCAPTTSFAGLGYGPHSVSARAIDGSDNEDATPASYSWLVEPEAPGPTPAASFLLAPTEDRLADALAGRYSVLAACASACRVSARAIVGARTAGRLGLGRKAVAIGSGAKRRGSPGTAKVSVPLTRKARAALRGRELTKATLKVTLTEGSAKLTIKRVIELRRGAGLRRVASRGLRLWAVCERQCPLSGRLTLSAAQARRLDLNPGRATRYRVASGETTATRAPKVLVLKVRRAARKAFARAQRVGALLEAVAGAPPNPLRTAKLSTTLRR